MDPNRITYFAETDARNKKMKFGIKAKDRLRHMYVIGKTGMGKSTLLENMAIQDIQNGEGIAVIDPHGSMADKLLEYVPEHRVKDVIYFAPFDMEYPISFNVMEDVGPDKRHLVVNGLMSTFEKIWVDAWSARMAYILSNTLLALLEYPESTLLGVNRMLSDKEYRKKVVENVKDTSVKAFWVEEFGKWTEKFIAEAIPAIQNKVGQFTSNPLVRNLLGQPKSSFDLRKIMDEKKIFIVNLSKGRVGEGNANLIGSMLITKMYLAAMSRADADEKTLAGLPNFYLYVDEFQSFANKSFADILSEARKYKLNLTIAHQYIEQMEEEVRNAVFGNVGTMITFRVGAFDAEVLEKEFSPVFTAEDLVNLGFAQIYLKLMIDGVSSQPFSATTMGPIAKPETSFKDEVIASSRMQFARPRKEVEEQITKFHEVTRPIPPGVNKLQEERRNQERRPEDKPQGGNLLPSDHPQPVSMATHKNIEPIRDTQKRVEQKDDPNKLAFLQAAEALKKRQQETLQKEQQEVKVEQQKPEPISLSELKPSHEKAKIPTKENINGLKDALSAVLKKEPTETPEPVKKATIEKPAIVEAVVQSTQPQVNIQKPKETPEVPFIKESASMKESVKEVPEDVLRSLLSMEN